MANSTVNQIAKRTTEGIFASCLICLFSGCTMLGCRVPKSEKPMEPTGTPNQTSPSDYGAAASLGQTSHPSDSANNRSSVETASGVEFATPSNAGMPAGAVGQAGSDDVISLVVRGVDPGKGPVMVAVFDSEASFPNHENAKFKVSLKDEGPVIETSIAITQGSFAIAAYQDQDGNGKLSKAAFGIPTEPYGFSNNAKGSMGPPSYQAASVDGNHRKQVEVTLSSLSF